MGDGDPRAALAAAAAARGESLAALSRLLGRNAAYLQQYVGRGTPRRLAEDDRRVLADYLALDERTLGASASAPSGTVVRRMDLAASAGPGSTVEEDGLVGELRLDPAFLRLAGLSGRTGLTLLKARGDSMAPTIADGSDLLVDTADRGVTITPRIFVLRLDGALLVKRLRRAGPLLAIESDNPAAPAITPRRGDEVAVIGRVVWLGRRL